MLERMRHVRYQP